MLIFIIKNSFLYYTSTLINIISRIVYIILIARFLGPDLYGIISYSQSWYMSFLPFTLFGFGLVIINTLSSKNKNKENIFSEILSIRLLLISASVLICLSISLFYIEDNTSTLLLNIFCLALIGRSIYQWSDEIFISYEKASLSLKFETGFRLAETIFGIFLIIKTQNLIYIALNHSLLWLAQGLFALYISKTRLITISITLKSSVILKHLKNSLPLGISAALNGLLFTIPILFYKQSGATNNLIGNLSVNIQALIVIGSLFIAISKAALPSLNRSLSTNSREITTYINIMLRIAIVFGSIVGILGLAFGEQVIFYVLNEKYAYAGINLGITLYILIPFIMLQAIGGVLIPHNKFWYVCNTNIIGIVILITSLSILIPLLNYTGVIISLLTGYFAMAFYGLFTLTRTIKTVRINLFIRAITVCLFALILFLLLPLSNGPKALISILLLLFGSYQFKIITKKEKLFIKNILS